VSDYKNEREKYSVIREIWCVGEGRKLCGHIAMRVIERGGMKGPCGQALKQFVRSTVICKYVH